MFLKGKFAHGHELNIMYEFMLYVEHVVRLCKDFMGVLGMREGENGVSERMK